VKRVYCSGAPGRIVVTAGAVPLFWAREQVARLAGRRRDTVRLRGMSPFRDWIDWLGGYPFEVASVDALVRFQAARGLVVERTVTTRRLGCNQIVLVRTSA
jgi:2-polyprenyl-6-hydroxyphenyl methylase/3-demethylubiquinone-9 3-methyltransferase